jgi:hypothetical protein
MQCVDCHVPDGDGRYMMAVTFEQHCVACHSLGQIEVAEGVVKPTPTPHGDEAEIAAVVNAQLYEFVAISTAKAGTAPAEETKPAAGANRRGRGSADAPKKTDLEIPKSSEKLDEMLVEQRDKLFKDLAKNTKCGYCHTVEKAEAKGSPFVVKNPHVPDRWFTRSVFSHAAHGMVSCQSCHAVEKSASASDINLPDIKSCRECHSPMSVGEAALGSNGAGDSCVMCHVYHPKGGTMKQGKLKPADLMRK